MSEARERYYNEKIAVDEICGKLVTDYVDELEQQKAELMDIAKEYMGYLLSGEIFAFDNENDRKEGERIKELLKNIT